MTFNILPHMSLFPQFTFFDYVYVILPGACFEINLGEYAFAVSDPQIFRLRHHTASLLELSVFLTNYATTAIAINIVLLDETVYISEIADPDCHDSHAVAALDPSAPVCKIGIIGKRALYFAV